MPFQHPAPRSDRRPGCEWGPRPAGAQGSAPLPSTRAGGGLTAGLTPQQGRRPELHRHVWNLAGQLHGGYHHVVTFLPGVGSQWGVTEGPATGQPALPCPFPRGPRRTALCPPRSSGSRVWVSPHGRGTSRPHGAAPWPRGPLSGDPCLCPASARGCLSGPARLPCGCPGHRRCGPGARASRP